jgi:hypothetical protein
VGSRARCLLRVWLGEGEEVEEVEEVGVAAASSVKGVKASGGVVK